MILQIILKRKGCAFGEDTFDFVRDFEVYFAAEICAFRNKTSPGDFAHDFAEQRACVSLKKLPDDKTLRPVVAHDFGDATLSRGNSCPCRGVLMCDSGVSPSPLVVKLFSEYQVLYFGYSRF